MSSRWWSLGLAGALALGCSNGSSVVGGPDDAATVDVALDLGATDASTMDLVDAQTLDVVVVDVPFRCTDNASCMGNAGGAVCDTASGQCVECLASADTCPAGQYCVAETRRCATGCRNDEGCASGAGDAGAGVPRHCDVTTRACVACVTDDHCPAGNLCVGNLCVVGCNASRACPSGQTCCSGGCVDTQSNTAACGACDNRCAAANAVPACLNGTCAVGTCTAPFADCNGAAADGCEVNTQSDVAHCGSCATPCAARANSTARCAAAACVYECAAGFADCDGDASNGCETDTRADLTHCGRCGGACSLANAAAACVASTCTVASCTTGFGDCDGNAPNGCETDLRTSATHCGACGTACATRPNAVPACTGGGCNNVCVAGYGECNGVTDDGCETNLATSAAHCGACGRTCVTSNVATATCAGSTCTIGTCAAGYADCDTMAANGCEVGTQTSIASCGMCGRACASAYSCQAGACVMPRSCLDIKTRVSSSATGVFEIDPDGPGGLASMQVYCDMTSSGGGWTLVLMAGNDTNGTLGYNSALWTGTGVLNPEVVDVARNVSMKNQAFNTLDFTAVRMCVNTLSACLEEPVVAASARALFSGAERLGERSIADFATWGYTGNLGCNRRGFNVFDVGGGTARCRYGILLNNESACEGSVDGARGIGCRGFYGTEVSAGRGDGIVGISHERGWMFVR